MRRRSPIFIVVFGTLATIVASRPHGTAETPGPAPPNDRHVVMFAERSFDLRDYRAAVLARRPAAEVEHLCDELDRRARSDQQPFTAAVEELGGRVLQHWWLINGCAIEVPEAAVARVRALPNVRSVVRDTMPTPASVSGERNDSLRGERDARLGGGGDHGRERAHELGYTGRGVAIAILDTGQDEDCGGSGRPHPLYFGGDGPNIHGVGIDGTGIGGPGIGGSRLVHNVQLGAMPKDDRIGHGTAVAAVAAGARWPAPGARAGHAPGARIAGYAVAERPDGASTDATIISAWQQVARDRARLHLVGANHSYGGSPDPTSPVQQALDSVAYNADLLVTVCAFNTGDRGSARSQSACNGLSVGAVTQDDHRATHYSARGPLHGDPERTYPDLCATSSLVGPSPDCSLQAGPWFGTSFAAPQVLGAAALVREAAPELSALETKAVLLASSLPLDEQDADKGAARNRTGVGLLRDDLAVATAAERARCRTLTVDLGAPTRLRIPVDPGRATAVAIAWHRTDFATADWGDVDLRITAGDRVVATGSSPRNLYEVVHFVPQDDSPHFAELVARWLPDGPLEVALATAELPDRPAMPATYQSFGAPCAGSALHPGTVVQHRNGDADPSGVCRDFFQLSAAEWLFEFTAPPSGLVVQGFELLAGLADGPAELRTALYLDDRKGRPCSEPAATGTAAIARQPGWIATRFADPVPVAGGRRYFVGVRPPAAGRFQIALGTGDDVHAWFRSPCTGLFVDGGSAPAGLRVLSGPEAPGLPPLLSNLDLPHAGATFHVAVQQLPPRAIVLLVTALDAPAASPIDLARFGAAGCKVLVPLGEVQAAVADAAGTTTLAQTIPDDPRLCGSAFAQQALVADPAANAMGLTVTHAARARIGDAD